MNIIQRGVFKQLDTCPPQSLRRLGPGSLELGHNSMDAVHRSCSAVTAFRPAWTPASPRVGPRSPVLLRRDRLPPSERALSVPLADGGTAAGALAWCGRRPAHYFADTPDGAWAEFLRHENITDPEDLDGVRETIWAIELPDDLNLSAPELPPQALLGGSESYAACQAEGRRLRAAGAAGLTAISAALVPTQARGWRVEGGLHAGPRRDGRVVVLYGARPELVGWRAGIQARPDGELLSKIRYLP